jgi:hypothetical protein
MRPLPKRCIRVVLLARRQGEAERPIKRESRRSRMSDSRLHQGEPDRSKINMNEDHEVKRWSKHLGISRERLQQLVEKVGNSAAAVRKELGA